MHEPEKSDSVVVAAKLTNKAERSAAELVEPRTGTKGNVDQQSTRRAQDREETRRGSFVRLATTEGTSGRGRFRPRRPSRTASFIRRSPHARNDPGPDLPHVVRVAGERTGEHAFLQQGATDHQRRHEQDRRHGNPGAKREACT